MTMHDARVERSGSTMPPAASEQALTECQEAAVAKLAYALEVPAAVAVLCGPAGSGTTTVLGRLAATLAGRGRACESRSLRDDLPAPGGRGSDRLLLLDDADETGGDTLAAAVAAWRRQEPAGGIVLAGEGRLLSLVARDARLARATVLRATLRPFTLAETAAAVESRLVGLVPAVDKPAIVRAIHEIAAGIPAGSLRLAELVSLVADAAPERFVTADHVEAVHRRLALAAA